MKSLTNAHYCCIIKMIIYRKAEIYIIHWGNILLDSSWRRALIVIVLAIISAIFSYARGYVEAQNSKKLKRDAEETGNGNAKKMLKLYESSEQNLNDALWASQMLLLVFEALLFGGICGDLYLRELSRHPDRGYMAPVIFLVGGLVYAFLYIVFIRRFFAACGTAKGRKTSTYRSYGLIRLFYTLSLPFSSFCNLITKALLKMFGIGAEVLDEDVTQDEILTLVDMGEESGAIESGEKEMIENVLDFTDVTAGDLLTHRTAMTAMELDTPEEQILQLIEESGYSRIPVYREDIDNIVGILSTRLFLLNLRKSGEEKKTLEELLYSPHFVPESVHATTLLSKMKKDKIHMSVVVDEYGGTAGIITMEDLLEEIVGNIYDETDDPSSEDGEITLLAENLWRIKGTALLEDIDVALGLSLPEDTDFETLSGLVFSCLTVIPEDGEEPEVECCGLHIQVEKIAERRIVSALVSLLPVKEEEE